MRSLPPPFPPDSHLELAREMPREWATRSGSAPAVERQEQDDCSIDSRMRMPGNGQNGPGEKHPSAEGEEKTFKEKERMRG